MEQVTEMDFEEGKKPLVGWIKRMNFRANGFNKEGYWERDMALSVPFSICEHKRSKIWFAGCFESEPTADR